MIDWQRVDTVFLDMDGTLLDLHFDNYFWQQHLPKSYAEKHGMAQEKAQLELAQFYKEVEGTLSWYCLEYWENRLGIEIMPLKREIAEKIALRLHVEEFLTAVRNAGKRVVMLTNAHRGSLDLKMEFTPLEHFFDAMISSHDFGFAKEQAEFWRTLLEHEPHIPGRSLMVDDNLRVLQMAADCGIGQCLAISQPDMTQPVKTIERFPAVADFKQVLPIFPY